MPYAETTETCICRSFVGAAEPCGDYPYCPRKPLAEREAAFRQWTDANRRPQELPAGATAAWVIRYEDQDVADEIFSSEDAEAIARRRFDQQRGAWSISLFQEVARA